MLAMFVRNWWVFAVRGVLAIIFGIMAILWPGVTLTVLILLFGAYVLVDGILNVAGAIMGRERDGRWWVRLVQGALGILVGLITFVWPGTTALVLLYLIAAWEVITGSWRSSPPSSYGG